MNPPDNFPRIGRRQALASLAASFTVLSGCPNTMPERVPEGRARPVSNNGSAQKTLVERVTQTLDREKRQRGLSIGLNGAWQIFHGILAYGDQFEVDTPIGRRSALTYFAEGGTCDGYRPVRGDVFEPGSMVGIRVDLEPSTKVGQGHRDQWLAVVAQAGTKLETPWIVEDQPLRIANWMRQAEYDVPLNYQAEFSWTLIPLSIYRPTDYRWTARDGDVYSTELLVESETLHDLQASVCGGTHRLIGVAHAVRKRRSEGAAMTGLWARAEDHLKASIELARSNQNPDGSYSTAYLHRSGWCQDLGELLGTTGHVVEFVAFAGDDQDLNSEWVARSVDKLCDVLDQCQAADLETGVLYHALHGLAEYRRRVNG
ncbi:hypothetical protein FYK55_05430 [Roseiconus nitratireducens]|uniref:Uncharacterized protein n=1 Tax=Roseiconus nitratireducens TaxID=2605748 RepID=A0A5M6DIL8_9BACT|nr:hypothetical protein [Roseiconus nitratireducens]KAA5545125.1 hypothetical protein FYK55_05430 [Roseiconus nitratireducens]